jgi:hypothetical protein
MGNSLSNWLKDGKESVKRGDPPAHQVAERQPLETVPKGTEQTEAQDAKPIATTKS